MTKNEQIITLLLEHLVLYEELLELEQSKKQPIKQYYQNLNRLITKKRKLTDMLTIIRNE